jgi:O-methyltransferase
MIGLRRLDSIQQCIRDVLQRGVPGDFLEAGVWRGGAAIFMRAILKVYGDTSRRVWAADSFQGLPKPDPRYPLDAGNTLWTLPQLAVSLEVVKANFERYGLLDDQVRFLVGWFHDTLPVAPIDRLSVLRVDGDLYSSTMDALAALYPKVSIGGYVIVDDYGIAALGCQRAVDDYRAREGITEPLQRVETAAFWQRH